MTVNMEREELGSCREDPVPPPPSPTPGTVTVTRLVVGPLSSGSSTLHPPHLGGDERAEQEVFTEDIHKDIVPPDVTANQPTSSNNSIMIPASTATIDLLQKTSRTLTIECKERLLSTSPASPASVTPDVCSTPRSPRQLIHPGLSRVEDEEGLSPSPTTKQLLRNPKRTVSSATEDVKPVVEISALNSESLSLRDEDDEWSPNLATSAATQLPLKTTKKVTVSSTVAQDVKPNVETSALDLENLTLTEEDKPGQYRLKWIKFKGNKLPIITQNENGPCPLIAIMNVLLLKGKLRLPLTLDIVTSDQLMEYLGDCILASLPSNLNEGAQLNYEQNMMDAIAILPKLQTGLDVNVRFTSISDFEFTPELIVFDLLHIPLHHGWIVDPINFPPGMAAAVGSCSYNQLVDKIITNKSSNKPELVTEGTIFVFLSRTKTHLFSFQFCSTHCGRLSGVNGISVNVLRIGGTYMLCQGRRPVCSIP